MNGQHALKALDAWRVAPGATLDLAALDADAHPASGGKRSTDEARLKDLGATLGELQGRLYANQQKAVLLVLQGMDASGKDGVVRRVFSQVSPLGVRAHAFAVPAGSETRHDFLWRVHAQTPPRGEIAIFNRSHYEDVVVASVRNLVPAPQVTRRLQHIRHFEQMLVDEGTVVLKLFLHLSYEEQGERLRDRLATREKQWKLQASDIADRAHWKTFRRAWERAIEATSTDAAPWYVVPANSRFQRDLMVAELMVHHLAALHLEYPPATLPPDTIIP